MKELLTRMEKTKTERNQLSSNIEEMESELRTVRDEISEVTRQNDQVTSELHSDQLAKHELE